MRKTEFGKTAFLLCLVSLMLCSCISRLARPEISGVIVDYDKNPVMGCKVGESVSDKNGHFMLSERRYNAFILTEIMVMEAPPLFVFELIEKNGFEKDAISIMQSFGGGKPKGAKYNIDTVFLKKNNQQFDLPAMLNNSKWNIGYTKNADTLYLIKDGFTEWCKTDRCRPFIAEYDMLTDNYYYSNAKNLPEGMIKRFTAIEFKTNTSAIELQQIRQYKSTFEGPNRAPDTLNTKGAWQLISKDTIQLRIDEMKSISGKFKITDVDLYQLKLIRNEDNN